MYTCFACGLSVLVSGQVVIRACGCNAPILAHVKGKASGSGGIKRP